MHSFITWAGGMRFEATPRSGFKFVLDGDGGPKPLETFLCALAACAAMDVLSILQKKRQVVTGYRVEIDGERPAEGEWPRPYTSITLRHVVTGDVSLDALARAVELSDTKYCSVSATLRVKPEIRSEWVVE